MTVHAIYVAYMNPELVGSYFGGLNTTKKSVKAILGKGAAIPLTVIAFRMLKSLGSMNYIPFGEVTPNELVLTNTRTTR